MTHVLQGHHNGTEFHRIVSDRDAHDLLRFRRSGLSAISVGVYLLQALVSAARIIGSAAVPASGGSAGEHIAVGVADHPARPEVQRQRLRGAQQHPGGGLATVARPCKLAPRRRDGGAGRGARPASFTPSRSSSSTTRACTDSNRSHRDRALGGGGLVGDAHQREAGPGETGRRRRGARDQAHVLDRER